MRALPMTNWPARFINSVEPFDVDAQGFGGLRRRCSATRASTAGARGRIVLATVVRAARPSSRCHARDLQQAAARLPGLLSVTTPNSIASISSRVSSVVRGRIRGSGSSPRFASLLHSNWAFRPTSGKIRLEDDLADDDVVALSRAISGHASRKSAADASRRRSSRQPDVGTRSAAATARGTDEVGVARRLTARRRRQPLADLARAASNCSGQGREAVVLRLAASQRVDALPQARRCRTAARR